MCFRAGLPAVWPGSPQGPRNRADVMSLLSRCCLVSPSSMTSFVKMTADRRRCTRNGDQSASHRLHERISRQSEERLVAARLGHSAVRKRVATLTYESLAVKALGADEKGACLQGDFASRAPRMLTTDKQHTYQAMCPRLKSAGGSE